MKKLIFLILFLFSFSFNCYSAGISIIRDSETEDFLYDLTKPIFKAANLESDNIKIYIVNDSAINAFVYGGQNVFINTGLIVKYSDPKVLLGVIAHEAGHIAAGHLARSSEEMQNLSTAMILTYLAGIAAAIAQPDVGYAVLMGGNQTLNRLALKYTRNQEEAADKLALEYLQKAQYPPDGLLQLLQFFDSQQTGYKNLIDEYALTHPVSAKRINYIKSNLAAFKQYRRVTDNNLRFQMARIIVKLRAFIEDPNKILALYQQSNNPLAKYSRSIAYFKKGEINKSLKELNQLIDNNQNDGYLWELKGQILFESGFIKESIIAYKKAIKLQSKPALSRIALASAIISLNSGDKELTNFAIDNLLDALQTEKNNPTIFKQLSKAYYQIGNKGRAYLALAELNLLKQDKEKTIKYAKLAKEELDESDKSSRIKADDILDILEETKG